MFARIGSGILPATFCLAAFAAAIPAQTANEISAADSAAIRVAMLRSLIEREHSPRDPVRIWIEPGRERDRATGQIRQVELTETEWAAVVEAFPRARLAPATGTLFLCPPGERVQMPGKGCPILDDGIIVSFDFIRVISRDTVHTAGGITQTSVGERRTSTWASGFAAELVRTENGWALRRILSVWMT